MRQRLRWIVSNAINIVLQRYVDGDVMRRWWTSKREYGRKCPDLLLKAIIVVVKTIQSLKQKDMPHPCYYKKAVT